MKYFILLVIVSVICIDPVRAEPETDFGAGVKMGYYMGQNGADWPLKAPLKNNNQGGFYMYQLQLSGKVMFDSSFSGSGLYEMDSRNLLDLYLEKKLGRYVFTAGKFRGAGLKSATGADEFSLTSIRRPLQAYSWHNWNRLHNFRDYGVQTEAKYLNENLKMRFFLHNANGRIPYAGSPTGNIGEGPTQALGADYAVDWTITPAAEIGGHAGAWAWSEWDEFSESWGEASGSWKWLGLDYFTDTFFKTNPIVTSSFYSNLRFSKVSVFTEALLMSNRAARKPWNNKPTLGWGLMSELHGKWNEKIENLFRYEMFDPTDGFYKDDNQYRYVFGVIWLPAPKTYSRLKLTVEYTHAREELMEDLIHNDEIFVQLQQSI